jgi:hypothetical protein
MITSSEAFTAVIVQFVVVWIVTPCSLVRFVVGNSVTATGHNPKYPWGPESNDIDYFWFRYFDELISLKERAAPSSTWQRSRFPGLRRVCACNSVECKGRITAALRVIHEYKCYEQLDHLFINVGLNRIINWNSTSIIKQMLDSRICMNCVYIVVRFVVNLCEKYHWSSWMLIHL